MYGGATLGFKWKPDKNPMTEDDFATLSYLNNRLPALHRVECLVPQVRGDERLREDISADVAFPTANFNCH